MKYLIFGNGYLAHKFNEHFNESVIDLANINDEEAVKDAIKHYHPEVVINCAARTGVPNIDWCEDHKLETLDSNLRGPLSLLKACSDMGTYWVQLGSGCIYCQDNDGMGWAETDAPNFVGSYYSRLKGVMNNLLNDFDVLQLRLRMPLDGIPGKRNFITKITNYPKVINEPNSMTVIDDLMVVAEKLIDQKAVGVYNVVNPGSIDHKEIIALYKEIVDPNHTCEFITMDELDQITKAVRSNCVLSTKKLEDAGIILPNIKERMKEILVEYKTNLDQMSV